MTTVVRRALFGVLGVVLPFLVAQSVATPALAAQDYGWSNDAPDMITGNWMKLGYKCDDPKAELLIIADGGYRWRTPEGSFRYARGQYSKSQDGYSVYFLVSNSATSRPDFQISVSGNTLTKYSLGNGESQRYQKCP